MLKKEEALSYGLSFDGTYQDAPFHDDNWQLVRVKENKKAFSGRLPALYLHCNKPRSDSVRLFISQRFAALGRGYQGSCLFSRLLRI